MGYWSQAYPETTTHCKQVPHQIPISGREGGNQTHETTAEDVLRCGAQIGTWGGMWFGGGVVCFSSQIWAERWEFVYSSASSLTLSHHQTHRHPFKKKKKNSSSPHPWFSPPVEQRDSRTTAATHIPEFDIPPTPLGVLRQPGTCLRPRLPHTLLFLFPGTHDIYFTGQNAQHNITQSLKVESAKAFCVSTAQFAFWTFVDVLSRILTSVTCCPWVWLAIRPERGLKPYFRARFRIWIHFMPGIILAWSISCWN